MLEPYDGKLSCTVLKGESGGNTADLLDTKCFEDNAECTELVLRIVMDKDDLKVKSVRTQYTIKNLQGRSVRLDIFADDSRNRKYNIEV